MTGLLKTTKTAQILNFDLPQHKGHIMTAQPLTPVNNLITQKPKTAKPRESTLAINKEIYAYTLMRAISSPRLLNICAVNKKGELIVVVESDLEFDDASAQVEHLNISLGHTDTPNIVV